MPADSRSGLSAAVALGRWTATVSPRAPVQFRNHTSPAVWDVACQQAVPDATIRPVTTQPVAGSPPPATVATRLDVAGSTSR